MDSAQEAAKRFPRLPPDRALRALRLARQIDAELRPTWHPTQGQYDDHVPVTTAHAIEVNHRRSVAALSKAHDAGWHKGVSSLARAVCVRDKDRNMRYFPSIGALARHFDISKGNVSRIVQQGFYKGYKVFYADDPSV